MVRTEEQRDRGRAVTHARAVVARLAEIVESIDVLFCSCKVPHMRVDCSARAMRYALTSEEEVSEMAVKRLVVVRCA